MYANSLISSILYGKDSENSLSEEQVAMFNFLFKELSDSPDYKKHSRLLSWKLEKGSGHPQIGEMCSELLRQAQFSEEFETKH